MYVYCGGLLPDKFLCLEWYGFDTVLYSHNVWLSYAGFSDGGKNDGLIQRSWSQHWIVSTNPSYATWLCISLVFIVSFWVIYLMFIWACMITLNFWSQTYLWLFTTRWWTWQWWWSSGNGWRGHLKVWGRAHWRWPRTQVVFHGQPVDLEKVSHPTCRCLDSNG